MFDAIGRGDIEAATRDLADDVHHVFPGEHPLGGERHSREAMQRWFERLFVLFPEIEFEVHRIAVRGPPWDMQIAVQWSDRGKAGDGEPYENEGAHWIRIRRGRGVYVRAYLDTERVSDACERMAAAGVEEASAPQITG